jgi:hypothetical protein
VSEVIDLYGATGKFDVIAITDHILMKKDVLARAGRIATLGRRAFGVRERDFEHYLENIRAEAQRALDQYGMLVVPGAEITQNRLRGRKNSHIIALDIQRYISADQSADDILREIRRQNALGPSRAARRSRRCVGSGEPGRSVLSDEPEALPVCRQQRFPQAEASLLVEDARAGGEELAGCQSCPARQRGHRADPFSQRILGGRLSSAPGRAFQVFAPPKATAGLRRSAFARRRARFRRHTELPRERWSIFSFATASSPHHWILWWMQGRRGDERWRSPSGQM